MFLTVQQMSMRISCKSVTWLTALSCTSTHIQLTDNTGQSMVRTSCGTEGFKNIKKSTPVAAQTAGISAAAVSSHLQHF